MTQRRLHPVARLSALLDIALALSESKGFQAVTRDAVARGAGVSCALVSHYFGSVARLRHAIMVAAVEREILPVIAQGLSVGNEIADRAPDYLKDAAVRSLL